MEDRNIGQAHELKSELRRRLVRTGWATPVVMSVAIPAHAAISAPPTTPSPVTTPASGPTPPPTTTPLNASCMVSASESTIALINGGGTLTPSVVFTVKNTGDVPLNSRPGTGLVEVNGGFGQLSYSGPTAIDDPLMPGASGTFSLTSLNVGNCGTSGTMAYQFFSHETICSVEFAVQCSNLG